MPQWEPQDKGIPHKSVQMDNCGLEDGDFDLIQMYLFN